MRTTIYDSWEEVTLADYKEFCENNDIEYDPDDNYGFEEFLTMSRENNYMDFQELISNKNGLSKYLILGTLGLWDGTHNIQPEMVDRLSEAIDKCTGKSDEITVEEENGVLYVTAYHHDGRNHFEIRELNEEGVDGYLDHALYHYDEKFQSKDSYYEPINLFE